MIHIGNYIIIFTLCHKSCRSFWMWKKMCWRDVMHHKSACPIITHRSVRGFSTNIMHHQGYILREHRFWMNEWTMAFRPDKVFSLFSLIWSAYVSHFRGFFLISPVILTPWTRQIALKTTSWLLTWQSGSLASSQSPQERKWMPNEGQTSSLWCSTSLNFTRCSATHLNPSQVPQ